MRAQMARERECARYIRWQHARAIRCRYCHYVADAIDAVKTRARQVDDIDLRRLTEEYINNGADLRHDAPPRFHAIAPSLQPSRLLIRRPYFRDAHCAAFRDAAVYDDSLRASCLILRYDYLRLQGFHIAVAAAAVATAATPLECRRAMPPRHAAI